MPHPKLTTEQKQMVCDCITFNTANPTELANMLKVHPRTIYRALEEKGIATNPKIATRKPSAGQQAVAILAKYGMTVEQLEVTLSRLKAASRTAALFTPQPQAAGAGASH